MTPGERLKAILWILGLGFVLVLALGVFFGDPSSSGDSTNSGTRSAASQPSTSGSESRYSGEVDDGRSFGEVIAAEMTGTLSPRQSLVRRFNSLLDSIAERCSRSREWVSDRVLGGHQALERRGGSASLLDVAEGWNEAVADVGVGDCQERLAALLTILENR